MPPPPPPSMAAQLERSWHLLTVLLRLGRPATPSDLAAEIASRFPQISPSADVIHLLCKIPDSPLLLTPDGAVTVSQTAVAAFSRFLAAAFGPRNGARVSAERERKRKSVDLVVATRGAKRRLFFSLENGVDEVRRCKSVGNGLALVNPEFEVSKEVLSGFTGILDSNIVPVGKSRIQFTSSFINQNCHLPSPIYHGRSLSRFGFEKNNFTVGCPKNKTVYHNGQIFTIHENFHEFRGSKVDVTPLVTLVSERSKISKPEDTTVCRDAMSGKCIELDKQSKSNTVTCNNLVAYVPPRNDVTLDERDFVCPKESDVYSNKGEFNAGHATLLMENGEKCTTTCLLAQNSSSEAKDGSKNILSLQQDHLAKMDHSSRDVQLKPRNVHKPQAKAKALLPKTMARRGSAIGLQSFSKLSHSKKDFGFTKVRDDSKESNYLLAKQNQSHAYNMPNKVNKDNKEDVPPDPKGKRERKSLPLFESFTIEEEEGSGGYGTVYRVKRKSDGKIFAVKYPHANANLHYVNNEMRMLEQFGGRNFVIKYEGSFRSGDNDCFVLEHVEHDRPEVLKKEIDVFEIQWYGYCIFRALASLHKQGIVHRDVKPGNFLFSRELNKGYLIDFNLACDLNQKFSKTSKSDQDIVKSNTVSLTAKEQASCSQVTKCVDNVYQGSKKTNEMKKHVISNKKRPNRSLLDALPKVDIQNKHVSRTADGSGITSTKDPTSTRTTSADRLKQPVIPYRGRKELINFLHETMQTPNLKEPIAPASNRKRVAAPLAKVGRKLLRITPMPLHSGRETIAASAGIFKAKGNGKQNKEGPCVGTKGFRAPEVLFKSFHQGCKLDVWSAGVTLLYLIIGKAPFGGDPEQNIKEIAKLRGSEDLWEVAKLHNRESSYPSELYDVKSLHSLDLREWCARNTKRPEFLNKIPPSLFDLVDKCLTVNPRCRISAEEALMHDFFVPCHESLRKQRMLRTSTSLEPGISPS